jgi:hypothetical protein
VQEDLGGLRPPHSIFTIAEVGGALLADFLTQL